jgi:hypothetical protein
LLNSLSIRGRYLLGRCFHNVLNANRAGKTVKNSGDQYIFPQETGGSLLVIYVVPGIVLVILQHQANLVLGYHAPAKRLPFRLRLGDDLLQSIPWQCARCWQDSAKENRYDRQDHSGSFHLRPRLSNRKVQQGGQQSSDPIKADFPLMNGREYNVNEETRESKWGGAGEGHESRNPPPYQLGRSL